MEKQTIETRKRDKRSDFWDWLWILGDILIYIPRLFVRLIRWFVDLF